VETGNCICSHGIFVIASIVGSRIVPWCNLGLHNDDNGESHDREHFIRAVHRPNLLVVLADMEGPMMRIELEDVEFQLRSAQAELRLAINEHDDNEICEELQKVIDTLTDVILRIQLNT
jgi:hypothetical protein